MGYGCSYVGWHEALTRVEPPAAQPEAAPRPAVRHHFPPCDPRRFGTQITKGLTGRLDTGEGGGKATRGADHLRIPDLIQICHVCKGRGLPSTGMRWCQKWDVHRHGVLGLGAYSRGVAGAREFQGLATATRWPPSYSRYVFENKIGPRLHCSRLLLLS